MKIQSKDISVIVQGPINHSSYNFSEIGITQKCISSIRELLPDATIILSTWKKQNITVSGYDILLENDDPKGQSHNGSLLNNVNRQIVSTIKGLQQANTKYCLKIRTDIILTSINFLELFNDDNASENDYQFLKSKVISTNLTSRNPNCYFHNGFNWKLLFHISDHVHFGYKEDLEKIWDIPLQTESEALYFLNRSFPEQFKLNEYARFAPEQYIATNFLHKYIDFDFKHYADWNSYLECLSETLLLNNFIFVKDNNFSIDFEKYHTKYEAKFEPIRYNESSKIVNDIRFIKRNDVIENPLISIIIPAYKSLPYIKETVESILSQSYDNFELIIIRNGIYQDDSEDLYFTSLSNIRRVKIIKLDVAGANIARKKGIEEATGDYLYVMDADDLLDDNALELISDNIKNYNSDCIVVGFSVFKDKEGKSETIGCYIPPVHTKQLSEYRCGTLNEVMGLLPGYNHTFWCFIFKKEVMTSDCINTNVKYYEEIQSLLTCFIKCKKISILPSLIYKYRSGTSTQLTSGWGSNNRIEKIEDLSKVIHHTADIFTAQDVQSEIKKYYFEKILNIVFSELDLSEKTNSANQEIIYNKLQSSFSNLNLCDLLINLSIKNIVRLFLVKNTSRRNLLKFIAFKDFVFRKLRATKQLLKN